MSDLDVSLRKETDLPPAISSFPPSVSDVGPGQGQHLEGDQGQLSGVRLGVEIVQRAKLKENNLG